MNYNDELIQKLYNLCYRLTGDTGLAQELCVKTLKTKDIEFQKGEETFTLLAKKAVELLLERKGSGYSGKTAPDDHAMKLQKALNNLLQEERIVIVLHDTYAFSYLQIASLFLREDVRILSKDGRKKLAHFLKSDLLERIEMLAR